jgi:15-cis-phytoene synthase
MSVDAALLDQAWQSIARGSSSFASAARLFDTRTRESVVLLYAWCRHCDDVIDGQQHGFAQTHWPSELDGSRVDRLFDATRRAIRGDTSGGWAFAALAEVLARHRIPERFALEHLSGFRMDVEGRAYRTIEDTLDYCYHVAGVVGLMMAMVMGRRDDATLDRAADLGLAFQLTNIARDVIDDHACGRIYLPADWLAQQNIAAADLAEPRHRERLAGLAARLVECAEPYYASASVGVAALPLRCAWAVAAAHGTYREIGLRVQASGPHAWDQRIWTPRRRKLVHLLGGAFTALASRAPLGPDPGRSRRHDALWRRPRAGSSA